jgi:hypothetical protein
MAFPVWEQVGELAYRAPSREDQRSMAAGDADFLERGFDPEVRCRATSPWSGCPTLL